MSSPSALTFCGLNLGASVQTERCETASEHAPPRAQPGWSRPEPAPGGDVHQVCWWPSAMVMGFPPPPYHFLTLRTLSRIHLCALSRLQGRTWCMAPEEGSFWCTLCLIVARERRWHTCCAGRSTHVRLAVEAGGREERSPAREPSQRPPASHPAHIGSFPHVVVKADRTEQLGFPIQLS